MTNHIDLYQDPVTGRPVVSIPQFGSKDPEDESRLTAPIPQVAGVYAKDVFRLQDLRKAYDALTDAGVKVSSDVEDAFAVLAAVQAYSVPAPAPQLDDMTPSEAVAALDGLVTAKARQGHVNDARGIVVSQAQSRLERAFRASVDSVLGQLAPRFNKASKAFMTEHDVVTRYASVSEAAEADQTGHAVQRWHAGRTAAAEMNTVADLVLGMVRTGPALRSKDDGHSGRIATLTADFEEATDVLAIAHASDTVTRGLITAETPLGMYPAVLASGGVLSLPGSAVEWEERIETFVALRDDAAINWFR